MTVARKQRVQSVIDKLQALANQPNNAPPANNTAQNQQNGQNANNSFPPRSNNQGGSLLNRVNNGNQPLSWMCTPVHTSVVRFDLRGLGDPFYRLLGHPLKVEYGEPLRFSEVVEQGGETALTLESFLQEQWLQYELNGAILVYPWNVKVWKSIARPVPMPVALGLEAEDSGDQTPKPTEVEPIITCLRSIDLSLVLNVLARARTQILLSTAPLILNRQYLMRSLVCDDPRLLDLVRATGYIEESL